MTTGVTGSSAWLPVQTSEILVQDKYLRSWNGGDGKYVVIDGVERLQYNTYTLDRLTAHRTRLFNKNFVDCGSSAQFNTFVFDDNDTIKLLDKLATKVKGHQLQAGVAIAEGAKTVKLVKESILTVGGALIDVKHGNFRRAAQRLGLVKSTYKRASDGRFIQNRKVVLSPEDISSRWLELQYGWKPLINDVYEACKAYEALTQGPRVYYFKASTKRFTSFDSSTSPSNYTCPTRGKLEQKILLEMREDISQNIPRSLGLEDPFTVAWELVPYSFVIDWFIPIGTYLAATNTIPLLTGRWYKTKARQFVCNRVQLHSSFYTGATIDYERLFVERTHGIGNLNVPLPSFKPLDQALSPLHVTNAIALVTSRLGRSSTHS